MIPRIAVCVYFGVDLWTRFLPASQNA